jgi:hypothetical protein
MKYPRVLVLVALGLTFSGQSSLTEAASAKARRLNTAAFRP